MGRAGPTLDNLARRVPTPFRSAPLHRPEPQRASYRDATPHRPVAVVTGASTGIGRDLAELLARDGYRLLLVARTAAVLERVAAQLAATYEVPCESFVADLARPDERERLAAHLATLPPVDVLINNAGIGVHGFFVETDLSRELQLIDLNVAALTHVTKIVLPDMVGRGSGRIMHVGSVASFVPGPLMAVYYASKAYALSFSEALSEELVGTGVTVTALCPGPTTTNFQAAAGIHATAPAGGAPPMPSMEVAEAGYRALLAGRRVLVPGTRNKIVVLANWLLPRRVLGRMVRRVQEKRRLATIRHAPSPRS